MIGAMLDPPKDRMTVDEFFVWAEGRDGKHELLDGAVIVTSPQRVRHAEVKLAACQLLQAAIRSKSLSCKALIGGVAVRIDSGTAYVPDALVYSGGPAHPDALEVPAPIIVVEVVSPSSQSIDTNRKLSGYFRVPSLMHYLVIDPKGPLVVHHRRGSEGTIEARILSSGTLDLDPPGLTLAVTDFFAEP